MIIITNPGELPGPTDDFPDGKVRDNDEGGLVIGFNVEVGQDGQPIVIMNFGKEVGWVGLKPDQIDAFCETLQHAKKQAQEVTFDREMGIKHNP